MKKHSKARRFYCSLKRFPKLMKKKRNLSEEISESELTESEPHVHLTAVRQADTGANTGPRSKEKANQTWNNSEPLIKTTKPKSTAEKAQSTASKGQSTTESRTFQFGLDVPEGQSTRLVKSADSISLSDLLVDSLTSAGERPFSSKIDRILISNKKDPTPLAQEWMQTAKLHCHYLNAGTMNMATITKKGRPCNRHMLLREFKDGCYYILTAKSSRKYGELTFNAYVGISFLWVYLDDDNRPMCRQMRIEGRVVEMDRKYTQAVYKRIPRIEKFRATLGLQGREVTWDDYEERHDALLKEVNKNLEICNTLPENIVTFKIMPTNYDFYHQILDNRTVPHRVCYRKLENGSWTCTNLDP